MLVDVLHRLAAFLRARFRFRLELVADLREETPRPLEDTDPMVRPLDPQDVPTEPLFRIAPLHMPKPDEE